jgi:hypothetical protein
MKYFAKKCAASIVLTFAAVSLTGCARPFELGWSPAYSADERGKMIARNWDYEGKQAVEDVDHVLLLRPMSHLTLWNLR